jgi:hypothetical protein
MRTLRAAVALTLALTTLAPLSAQAPAERKLQISFDQSGNVTIVAQNVTIAEILAEWGRQGGTMMVNANRLAGGPVSRFYVGRPETEVIESLLRQTQAAGFIVTPRRAGAVGASRFEVVQITPTSVTSGAYTSAPSTAVSAPLTTPGAPDDELPPITPPGVANPPATVNAPQPAPTNTNTYPGASGVAVPVVPVVPIPGGRGGTPSPTPAPGTPAPGTPGAPGTTGRGGGGGGL